MAMRTVFVVGSEGRVCYITTKGDRPWITIEDPENLVAYRFTDPMSIPLRTGEWIRVSGLARVEIISKNDELERLKRREYYHDPHDGSAKVSWEYHDLVEDVQCERIGPPAITNSLMLASAAADRHIQDWITNLDPGTMRETAVLLNSAAADISAIAAVLEAERDAAAAKIKSIDIGDINVDDVDAEFQTGSVP